MTLRKLFLTCPIFYINAKPHLGHAYTLCLADSWSRYAKLRGHPSLTPFANPGRLGRLETLATSEPQKVSFLTSGTDERGAKVKQAAFHSDLTPQEYCDKVSPIFKALCGALSVELSDFVRTTEERHQRAVSEFWRRLSEGGHLYRSTHSGWYSVADESFYEDWEITAINHVNSNCPSNRVPPYHEKTNQTYVAIETGSQVEWTEETNVLFRLSSFKEKLHKWLNSGVFLEKSSSQKLWLDKAHSLVDAARDVSVSRPTNRLDWGIPAPDNPDQVIYVWLDALVSYLTVAGFPWSNASHLDQLTWPPDFQFIGKDILKFHSVLWPALLMAVDLPLPRYLICHSHLLHDGFKMSKSRDNVVDPFSERLELTPNVATASEADSDGLRYVLLRSALLTSDASYNRAMAKCVINTELVNCLGNLLSRITSVQLNPNQSVLRLSHEETEAVFNVFPEDVDLLEKLNTLAERFDQHWWERAQPHLAIEQVISVLRNTNALLDRHKPWDKNPSTEPEYVVAFAAESLRLAGLLLRPVVPNVSARLLRRLGLERQDRPGDSKHHIETKYYWELGADEGPLLQRIL